MKVGIITRHAISNYGSLLQSIAMQEAIKKIGHESEIINYIRKDESIGRWELTTLSTNDRWNKNAITRLIYLLLRYIPSLVEGMTFQKYRKQKLCLTREYSSCEELRQNPPIEDIYMTGSDQVWGNIACGDFDDTYLLSFVDDKKKVSYAASFGKIELDESTEATLKKYIKDYKYVSVREKSGRDILNNINIEADVVLDPTFLLSQEEWLKYSDIKKSDLSKKYLLVYQIHNGKNLMKYAKEVAKQKGIPIIRISPSLHQIFRGGKFVWLPTISGFLKYIRNAEIVVTDSFHGTALAINLNAQFVEVLPNNNTSTRNMCVLEEFGLQDRVVSEYNLLNVASKEIDYSKVNKVLADKRELSLTKLKKMIEE